MRILIDTLFVHYNTHVCVVMKRQASLQNSGVPSFGLQILACTAFAA